MKKIILVFSLCLACGIAHAQYYRNVVSYSYNSTPSTGVKIKTNIPFSNYSQMPMVSIQGYCYGKQMPMSLNLVWYVYNGNFVSDHVSSSGGYTPEIKLSNEGGKVVIYINEREYYMRFYVSAFATGLQEQSSWFTGWTVVNQTLNGTNTVTVPYRNQFAGTVNMPGSGVWSDNVGIGTMSPDSKLTVKGKIHAQEVKVDLAGAVAPDYVFDEGYSLRTLEEVQAYITKKGHLPGIPSADEMEKEGINLKEMNLKLLEKVEELTLYIISLHKKIKVMEGRFDMEDIQ